MNFVIPYTELRYYDWDMKEIPCEGLLRIYTGGDSRAELTGEVIM